MQGRVLDEDGKPVPNALVEIWQCNAAGRYHHPGDQHDAPLDPNFYGGGRARADAEGSYRFVTVKPGAYPWGNHHNAWRPAHIHFSLFGPAFATRLITQMYFPNDPLLAFDPIYNSVPAGARAAPAGRLRHGPDPARMGPRLPLRHRAARPQRHADGMKSMPDNGSAKQQHLTLRRLRPSHVTFPVVSTEGRRPERRPSLHNKLLMVERRSLHSALRAPVETTEIAYAIAVLRDAGLRPAPQGEVVGSWIDTP